MPLVLSQQENDYPGNSRGIEQEVRAFESDRKEEDMKIYCMSDIHGCLPEFEEALSLVEDYLKEPDTKLCLLGDYIHGGADSYGVLDKIMRLQDQYGTEKVIALMGNHEEHVLSGIATINQMTRTLEEEDDEGDEKYIYWIENLPRYYTEGNTPPIHYLPKAPHHIYIITYSFLIYNQFSHRLANVFYQIHFLLSILFLLFVK